MRHHGLARYGDPRLDAGRQIPAGSIAGPVEVPELRGAPRAGLFRGAGRAQGAGREGGRLPREGSATTIKTRLVRLFMQHATAYEWRGRIFLHAYSKTTVGLSVLSQPVL